MNQKTMLLIAAGLGLLVLAAEIFIPEKIGLRPPNGEFNGTGMKCPPWAAAEGRCDDGGNAYARERGDRYPSYGRR